MAETPIHDRIDAALHQRESIASGPDEATRRPLHIAPPVRSQASATDRALTLSTVYRGVQIHTVAAIQLGLDVHRDGKPVTVASLIRKPDVTQSREAFIEYTVASMWLQGEAFWRKNRADATAKRPGEVVGLTPLNPAEVHVGRDRQGNLQYAHQGKVIPVQDVQHLKMLRVPGRDRGLGPIQAARMEIEGTIDARDYGSSWFSEGRMPNGLLTTDQELSPELAQVYKEIWNEGANGHEARVLGSGLSYSPLLLKPADVQFLESQQFNTTGIARLLGVPASLMLAAVEGKSNTYSNITDEWRAYLQFSAMKPLREIEVALSDLLPGQQRVRFNLDAFLRVDTKARYEAHEIGLRAGFLSVEEVRDMEGLDPDKAPAPTKEISNADA